MPSKIYQEYPKTVARDDFWRQVKRTVNGVPVSQAQIDMIVSAISDGLSLSPQDVLLDLGCGNGALSQYFFEHLAGFEGIDASEYLIGVAKEYFGGNSAYSFSQLDIDSYLRGASNPERFTKCLCYGVFSYLENAEEVLDILRARFRNIQITFIGNLPDKDLSHLFHLEASEQLDDPCSPSGIWRSREEFIHLANITGWNAELHIMPNDFYAAHYRYDAILERL